MKFFLLRTPVCPGALLYVLVFRIPVFGFNDCYLEGRGEYQHVQSMRAQTHFYSARKKYICHWESCWSLNYDSAQMSTEVFLPYPKSLVSVRTLAGTEKQIMFLSGVQKW